MSETFEEMVVRVGADKAPRITPADIEAKIATTEFFHPTATLTIVVVTLTNKFTVTGESACASPENYNEEIGNKIALDMARSKIWMLEGYLLREKLSWMETVPALATAQPASYVDRMVAELAELCERHDKLAAFIAVSPVFTHLSVGEQLLLCQQADAMRAYRTALQARVDAANAKFDHQRPVAE